MVRSREPTIRETEPEAGIGRSSKHPHQAFFPLLRRRRRSCRFFRSRHAVLCARLRAAGIRPWGTVRRRRYGLGDDLDAGRSAGARFRRIFDHGKLFECREACRYRCDAADRLRRQVPAPQSAAGPGHLLSLHRDRSLRRQSRLRTGRRALPDGSLAPPLRALRLVRRHGGAGLGHRRGRHEDLFDHAAARAGFLHPFRRHDLCRQSYPRRDQAARRRHVEEPDRHAREARRRADARGISRPVEIQPARRACAEAPCRMSHLLSVGRPRGPEQLVGLDRSQRRPALSGEGCRRLCRPRGPRVSRDDGDPHAADGARPHFPQDRLWSAARRLLRGSALLSRPQPGRGGGAASSAGGRRTG